MSNENSAARLAALVEHSPCSVAILSTDGICLVGSGRGWALAASPAVVQILQAKPPRAVLAVAGARLVPYGTEGEWLLVENDPDEVRAQSEEAGRRRFLRDVLNSVTQGKLHLAFGPDDLPPYLPQREQMPLRPDVPLASLRAKVRDAAQDVGIPEARAYGAALAVGEVAMNAVIHGGGGEARLGVAPDTPGGGTVQVYVEDHGPGIALEELPKSALVAGYSTKNSMGMGFFLTLQEADRVYLRTGVDGTTIVVEVDRQPTLPLWLSRAGFESRELESYVLR